jgi:hypothetical protein
MLAVRFFPLYLKAPNHEEDASLNWRGLPLFQCKPSIIQTHVPFVQMHADHTLPDLLLRPPIIFKPRP